MLFSVSSFPFLALAQCLLSTVLADPPVFTAKDDQKYDSGGLGVYPEIKYKTSELVSPQLFKRKWDDRCNSDAFIFFCPRGFYVGHAGPMILDNAGHMVWHNEAWPVAYGLTVQKYRGENYLTFWSGNDQVIGHGSGNYFMLDKHYNQYKMISPIGDITGDLHEFKITADNTALLTSYISLPWDLSAHGRTKDSFIWECVFQEIDIETDTLLFEWRATDHFTFKDCYNPLRNAGAANNPWDWFHINSVEKDKRGNYLISSRYSHALTYINGRTGQPMWHLGGKNNSFRDITPAESNFKGGAVDFAWQHDARWIEPFKSLSIFDNAAYFADQSRPARGLKIEIDIDKRTAKLLGEAKHPKRYVSESQGSAQVLKNGNIFLGYGSASAMTEFSPDGSEILCDMQYGALHYKKGGEFSPSGVMSYRIYKNNWVGWPSENPKVVFEGGKMYVSWNGATEVTAWLLEGTNTLGSSPSDWEHVSRFKKSGFESNTTVDHAAWSVFRMIAFDKKERKLGAWVVYSGGEVKAIPIPEAHIPGVFLVLLGSVLTVILASFFRRRADIIGRLRSRIPMSRGYLPVYNQANGSAEVSKFTESDVALAARITSPTLREY